MALHSPAGTADGSPVVRVVGFCAFGRARVAVAAVAVEGQACEVVGGGSSEGKAHGAVERHTCTVPAPKRSAG
jgi:hypothetical protein